MHIKLIIAGAVSNAIECQEETFFLMELQLTLEGEKLDSSSTELFGPKRPPGLFDDADVTLRYIKRYSDTGAWAYYDFHRYKPKSKSASMRPENAYAFSHVESAERDNAWT